MAKRKAVRSAKSTSLTTEQIDTSILVIRGHKVLLDDQLAVFYGVETKVLVQAMKRNIERFPDDFMFQLDREEWVALRSQFAALDLRSQFAASNLRSQIVTSSLRSQSVTLKQTGYGGRRYAPYAFTEQGVAMLSSVLRSPRAIEVNIEIMRAFIRIRQLLSVHKELAERLEKLERQMRKRDDGVDQQFRHVFALLEQLFTPPKSPRKPIGFHAKAE
ncbi:MAG: ORF6N domain-containing protein [Pirellulales bacterium]